MKYDKAAEQDRIQNAVTEIIDSNFQHKDTNLYHGYPEHQNELAPNQEVMRVAKNISHQFIARYGTGNSNEWLIETLILNEINRDWRVPKVRITGLHSYEWFIDNEFIPNNSTILWNIMNEVYGETLNHDEDTEQILKLLYEWVIDYDDIQKPDFMSTISLIEEHFLLDSQKSKSFSDSLERTLDVRPEDIEDKDIYARQIWVIAFKWDTYYIYSAIVNNTRYIITSRSDMWRYHSHVSAYDFEHSKSTLRQILELL